MNLTGNTILITGGTKGIGFELAKRFLDLNNKVIICGRSEENLAKAKDLLPEIELIKCDVSNLDDREKLIRKIKNQYKELNVLINNAGIQRDVDFNSEEDDLFGLDEISINLEAPIYLTKALIPLLKTNKNSTLINVTSGLAFTPLAKMPIYCATKAAMHSLTVNLRHQLKDNIEVIEIIPPAVDTELNPEGREKRLKESGFKCNLQVDVYVDEVMKGLKIKALEIGFNGNIERVNNSTKLDLENIYKMMNK